MLPELDASISCVTDVQRQQLAGWLARVDRHEEVRPHWHQIGLWIYGPRLSGSTYIARVAARRMWEKNKLDVQWEDAKDLLDIKRDQWTLDDRIKRFPDDNLYQEQMLLEMSTDRFWQGDVACVNDLYSDLDIRFWRRFLQPEMESRIKRGQPTIVATDMPPNYREFDGLQPVIEHYFVVCDAAR